MGRTDSASTSLAPGFRFHPTDEELVSYYLKRKICGKSFRFDAVAEIDIYRVEPWDLPGLSKLKSRDLEWYFFSSLDKKYGNGSRTNRATGEGYWKTTGKDRPVHHRSRVVGMKKTLVYHQGRAPRGKRTNWVMHEYKLVDEALEKAGFNLEGYVLCRIFQKSGAGPKNGEQYGAPFAEEEWEKDEADATVPGEVLFEEPFTGEDSYIEQDDFDKSLDWQLPRNVPAPDNLYHEDNSVHLEDSRDIAGSEKCFARESEYKDDLQVLDDQRFFNLPVQGMNNADIVRTEHMVQGMNNADIVSNEHMVLRMNDADIVRNEHMVQPNVTNETSANCLPNEPLLDTAGNDILDDDGFFLDAMDFLDPAEENPFDFGISEQFVDDDIDIGQYLTFDAAPSLLSNDMDQSLSTKERPEDAEPELHNDGFASSSKQVFEVSKPAIQYPYLSQASRLLGNIPAPPAFASELPSKDMAARLSAAVQSSSSGHVTAGMIRIRDMTLGTGSRVQWSLDKMGNVNVLLSFDLPEDVSHSGLGSLPRVLSGKVTAALSWGWLRSMLWVLVFAASFKIGSLIYAK